jgi:hypothetical protein
MVLNFPAALGLEAPSFCGVEELVKSLSFTSYRGYEKNTNEERPCSVSATRWMGLMNAGVFGFDWLRSCR